MPYGQPSASDLHTDGLLGGLLIAYYQDPGAYIADKIFPIVEVKKQSNKIPMLRKEDFFRDQAELRTPGTESVGSGFGVNTQTYFCDNYAYHQDVPDEVRENQDDPFDVDDIATNIIADVLKMRREKAFATDFFKTGVWGTDVTPAAKWSDYGLGDPIGDVQLGQETIHPNTGLPARTLVIGVQAWNKLRNHPDFIERIKYVQKGILTASIIAEFLDIDQVLVGRAIENTAKEGATPAFVGSYVFGKHALLLNVAPRPGLMVATAGMTYHWSKMGAIGYIRRVRDNKAMYDRIEGHTWFDQKQIGSDLGYFMNSVVV